MAPADGFRRAHRPLGLLRLPSLGRRQAGRTGRRWLPPDAGAAVLWRPAWAPEERLAGSHGQLKRSYYLQSGGRSHLLVYVEGKKQQNF